MDAWPALGVNDGDYYSIKDEKLVLGVQALLGEDQDHQHQQLLDPDAVHIIREHETPAHSTHTQDRSIRLQVSRTGPSATVPSPTEEEEEKIIRREGGVRGRHGHPDLVARELGSDSPVPPAPRSTSLRERPSTSVSAHEHPLTKTVSVRADNGRRRVPHDHDTTRCTTTSSDNRGDDRDSVVTRPRRVESLKKPSRAASATPATAAAHSARAGPNSESRVRLLQFLESQAPDSNTTNVGGETLSTTTTIATGRTRPVLHRTRSAYTIKPKSASAKSAARRPSTANNDTATNLRKTLLDPGVYWEKEEMGSIKDRLSIQTFIPQALRVQSPPSTPTTSTHAASTTPRRESVSRTAAANTPSPSGSGSVLRRGFGRARAQTHTGTAITSVLASSSSMLNENDIRRGEAFPYPVLDVIDQRGRESPPTYLLDDDPFAAAMPLATTTPGASPAASTSTASMPSTPGMYHPHQPTLPPIPMTPTTPPSPLNPHTKDKDGANGGAATVVATTATTTGDRDRDKKGKSRSTPTSPSMRTSAMPSLATLAAASSSKAGPSSSASTLTRPPPPMHAHSTPLPSFPTTSTPSISPPHTPHASASTSFSPPQTPPHPPPSRTRPAHTRPAFAPRPSLPSLNTLARMDIPISAFTGMVGLHYGRKKRKGRVGAHLPLEPWAQPEDVDVDVDVVADMKSEQEEEGGEGKEEMQVRAGDMDMGADVVDLVAPPPETLDKSLPATPTSTSSDGDACSISASEIPVVVDDPESPQVLAEASSEAVVECQKELPDVPFTPERGSFFSQTGGKADEATQAKVAAAQARAAASEAKTVSNSTNVPALTDREPLDIATNSNSTSTPGSLQLSSTSTVARPEYDDQQGVLRTEEEVKVRRRPEEEIAISGASHPAAKDLPATAIKEDVNRDRPLRNELSAFDANTSLPLLNFQRLSRSSIGAALDLVVEYDDAAGSELGTHPVGNGLDIDSDWDQPEEEIGVDHLDAGRAAEGRRAAEQSEHVEDGLVSVYDSASLTSCAIREVTSGLPSTSEGNEAHFDSTTTTSTSTGKQDESGAVPTTTIYETPAGAGEAKNRVEVKRREQIESRFEESESDAEQCHDGELALLRDDFQLRSSVPLATSSLTSTAFALPTELPATATVSAPATISPDSTTSTPIPATDSLLSPLPQQQQQQHLTHTPTPHRQPTLAIAIPLHTSGRGASRSSDVLPPASPSSSVEDFGIVLPRSISPNYSSLLQVNARPDSFTLDPELPVRSRSNTLSEGTPVEEVDQKLDIEVGAYNQTQITPTPISTTAKTTVEEDDSSMLPLLSTLPEDDPVFSFSPNRTHSTDVSRKSSWSSSLSRSRSGQSGRSGRSNSSSTSGYGSLSAEFNYPPSLPSLQGDDLGVRRGRQGSDSSVSTSDELSSSVGSYVAQAYVTPPGESLAIQKFDDAELASAEGPFAPRSSHAAAFYDRDSGLQIPTGVDEHGWRPFNGATAGFEPGSSSSTLRASLTMRRRANRNGSSGDERMDSGVLVDAAGGGVAVSAPMGVRMRTHAGGYSASRGGSYAWKESSGGDGYGYGSSYYGGRGRGDSSGSDYGRKEPGDGRRNGGNGRDDGRGDDNGRSRKTTVSVPSTSDSESSESEDDYGQERPPVPQLAPAAEAFNQRRNGRRGVFKRPDEQPEAPPTQDSTEDDDVPLAQRIPTALQAQKSIRRQVRDEREQRRRDRALSRSREDRTSAGPSTASTSAMIDIPERGRTASLRHPASAAPNMGPSGLSSSQEAALIAQRVAQAPPVRRARAKTIGDSSGFAPDDLTKRLLKVQALEPEVPRLLPTPSPIPRTSGEVSAERSYMSPMERILAPASAVAQRAQQLPPAPPLVTRQSAGPDAKDSGRTLRPMRSFHHPSTPGTTSPIPAVPIVRRPTSAKGRQSQEGHAEEHIRNKLIKSARSSLEGNRPSLKGGRSSIDDSAQPPVPPLPASARLPSSAYPTPVSPVRTNFPSMISSPNVVQMRIFIGDLQRFNMVEVGPETNAKDVLDMLGQQGDLRDEIRRSTGWMLFEICQDYGMERPIRNYELITDISGSWNKEKTANVIMVKRSSLSFTLANIPTSIPKRSGYVDYESKKGKWSKRWLELREHGLWLSKREGKDDEFLCSLSAFDAYIVTRIHKAPKSFVFAVKSTDPVSLFENKADYLHMFSCSDDVGRQWLESILLARSYILYQERNVLFRNKGTSPSANTPGAALSRAGTRKRAPTQPLVSVAPPYSAPTSALPSAGPFEPGSLLAKRTAEGA